MREAASGAKDTFPFSKRVSSSSLRKSLPAITLLALILRLLVVVVVMKTQTATWFFHQATELGCLAESALRGDGLGSPFCGHTGPSAFLAPGYPLLITAVFRAFGAYSRQSMLCVLALQAAFGTATVAVTMWAARPVFGLTAARIAGLLCALNPWLIGLEAVFWETSLSIMLLTALLGTALRLQRAPTSRRWFWAAALLAIAGAVNPSLVLTGTALFILACATASRRSPRLWLMPALIFLLLSSIWPARNLRALHSFVPMRTNLGYELWQGNHTGATGFFQESLHPNVNVMEYARYKQLGEMGYMQEKSRLAKNWITTHPGRFVALTLKRIACFWLGIRPTPSALLIVSTALLSIAGLGALFVFFGANRAVASLFAAEFLLLPLPYYISHPDFRFWCLLAPSLTMLAAWWLSARWLNTKAD